MDSPEEKNKPSTTLPGTVEKIIKPIVPGEPDKAQIEVEQVEDLYREIRIDNVQKDEKGEEVALKEGAPVKVTIEADKKDTPKSQSNPGSGHSPTSYNTNDSMAAQGKVLVDKFLHLSRPRTSGLGCLLFSFSLMVAIAQTCVLE